MTYSHTLALAKQGDSEAIKVLLNQQLKTKNITVKVALKDHCLQIMLESSQILEQKTLVDYIHKTFVKLNANSIKVINVFCRQTGNDFPVWTQNIELDTYKDLTLANPVDLSNQILTVKPVTTIPRHQNIKSTYTNKHTVKKNSVLILSISISTFLLLIISSFGLIFWQINKQRQALSQASTLVAKIDNSDTALDIKSLKENKDTLNKAIIILDNASSFNFPGSINLSINIEKQKIHEQLNSLEENLKIIENLIPEAKKVVGDFAAINSRLNVGMNYRSYGTEVGTLKVVIDRFSELPGAKQHPIYKDLVSAFDDYDLALNVWRNYIESDETNSFLPATSPYGNVLISEYQVETQNIVGEDYIYLNSALTKVWQKASKNIELAKNKI